MTNEDKVVLIKFVIGMSVLIALPVGGCGYMASNMKKCVGEYAVDHKEEIRECINLSGRSFRDCGLDLANLDGRGCGGRF